MSYPKNHIWLREVDHIPDGALVIMKGQRVYIQNNDGIFKRKYISKIPEPIITKTPISMTDT